MKTGVYKYRGREFKYRDPGMVLMVTKATDDEYRDNEKWQREHGHDFWDIDEDGYVELGCVGLMKANWENKEARDVYLDQFIDDFDEESAWLVEQFTQFELPHLMDDPVREATA